MILLENEMRALRGLPDRVASLEGNFLLFRTEVRGEFSAMRGAMKNLEETLRQETRDGDEETRRLMRVLHEDLVARMATISRG